MAVLSVNSPAPEIVQVTPAGDGSCWTVAVSAWLLPGRTVAELGSIVTTSAGTMIVAEADLA